MGSTKPKDLPTIALLEQYFATGDQDAAWEVYQRYVRRLVGLVGNHLSPKLAKRVGAEEVAQSALRTFFIRYRDGRLRLEQGKLWALLSAIALNKLRRQADYHQAGRRSLDRELHLEEEGVSFSVEQEVIARGPTPEEELALEEELEKVKEELDPQSRLVLDLALAGCPVPEIARAIGRSERRVRQVKAEIILPALKKRLDM